MSVIRDDCGQSPVYRCSAVDRASSSAFVANEERCPEKAANRIRAYNARRAQVERASMARGARGPRAGAAGLDLDRREGGGEKE
uniref:hypothetical protein n=1 Tax=Aeromonas sp. EERV15 TaxID=1833892 RepID=UPI001C3FF994